MVPRWTSPRKVLRDSRSVRAPRARPFPFDETDDTVVIARADDGCRDGFQRLYRILRGVGPVGHLEHPNVICLVAKHHELTLFQPHRPPQALNPPILCGLTILDHQPVPVG
jgi:hypothetical protein